MSGARGRRGTAAALILAVAALPGPWGGDAIPAAGRVPAGLPGDPARGARLFRQLDCTRCHTEPRSGRGIDVPPSLEFEGSRARPAWLADWLRDPEPLRYAAEGVRPAMRMPPVQASTAEMQDLVAYLTSLRDSVRFANGTVPSDSARVAEGEVLFTQYQCRGCHQLGGHGGLVGPALDGVGRRRRAGYVRELLRDPRAIVPGTAMKDFELWDDEVTALTGFIVSLRGTTDSSQVP